MKQLYIFSAIFCNFLSCSEKELLTVQVNDSFSIDFNEKIQLQDSFILEFIQVEDDRCLQEKCSTCFGTSATAWFSLTSDTQIDTIELQIVGCKTGEEDCNPCDDVNFEVVKGIKFGLLKLAPYPTIANSPILIKEYKATMKILPE